MESVSREIARQIEVLLKTERVKRVRQEGRLQDTVDRIAALERAIEGPE